MSNAEIKIKEGNWGQFYAVRFEVWFSPDSEVSNSLQGESSDRKLLEKVFKIEGRQF